jgi:Domain of unknown function (DUF4864)
VKISRKIVVALIFSPIVAGFAQVPDLNPEPKFSPEEVVQYQVRALQHNDDPHPDAGIERTFRFASPSNKRQTGPLEHFVSIVKSVAYLPMVNNLASSVVGSQIEGDHAKVVIRITPEKGPELSYLFVLTKQHDDALDNCWMTDSVLPIQQDESPSDEAITI